MMTEIPLDAAVRCREGLCGRSTYVIINPITQEVTHFVVKEKRLPQTERLVPIEWIEGATRDLIRLRCTKDELANLEPFVATEFIKSERPRYVGAPHLMWPYVVPETIRVPVKHRRIPPGELAVRRGVRVRASDGDVGWVSEFLLDPVNGHISHLVLGKGRLWGRAEVAIPFSEISDVREDTVYLKLDKHAIESLPRMLVRHRYPCTAERDMEPESRSAAGNGDGASNRGLRVPAHQHVEGGIGLPDAVLTSRDQNGTASLQETEEFGAKQGALFGAIAGYVIGGLLAGAPGVFVGTIAGAAVGGVAACQLDRGFAQESLKDAREALETVSSAVLLLVEDKWTKGIGHKLGRFRSRLFPRAPRESAMSHPNTVAEANTHGKRSEEARL